MARVDARRGHHFGGNPPVWASFTNCVIEKPSGVPLMLWLDDDEILEKTTNSDVSMTLKSRLITLDLW